jgi:ribonuclease HII
MILAEIVVFGKDRFDILSVSMKVPNFKYEKVLWQKGIALVGGCDEVGRGCFAGPVVAGAVVFPKCFKGPSLQASRTVQINDSKKLTASQRDKADKWIRKNALSYGLGEVSVKIVNKLGIKKATEKAFRIAVSNCKQPINHLLIDAFFIPRVKGLTKSCQTPIVKGDSISFSIAAASIIAKVYRDALMKRIALSHNFKVYGWNKNKGYGTKTHCQAILRHGTTPYHRTTFVETFLRKRSIDGKN